jgi:hypothetical protein
MAYRVIQWATGAMGKTCLRSVIDHPALELVGLYVYSEAKEGMDAGEIAARPATGIRATRELAEILSLEADVVLHCPLLQLPYSAHDEEVCRLLESGKDVISINNYFHPASLGAGYAARLAAACAKGSSTLCGTGLNPGFVMERIAAAATGVCVEFESILCREVYDCLEMPNANYVFGVMGMGSRPDALDLENGPLARMFGDMYRQCVGGLAHRMGLELDRIDTDNQLTLAPRDIQARAGMIRRGTVAATNWQLHGVRDGQRVITNSVNWVMGRDVPGYEQSNHWEITVRGKPGLEVRMDLLEVTDASVKTRAVQYGVAGMVTQAIPLVCTAAPGLFLLPGPPVFNHRLAPGATEHRRRDE